MSPLTPRQEQFRQWAMEAARQVAPVYEIPWKLMAAAAILESGWGESALAREGNNYFGIRALPNTPPEKVYILEPTKGRFRHYDSPMASFHAYGRLLAESRHYLPARQALESTLQAFEPLFQIIRETLIQAFLIEMAPVYCPDDPDYQTKMLQLVDMLDEGGNRHGGLLL